MEHVSRCHFGSNVWCFVAYRSDGDVAETLTMANRSPPARNAAKTVPAPVGQAVPGEVAVKVSTFLELAPGIPSSPASLAKLQKILKSGRPGRRDGGGVHKGYCRKLGRVLVRIWWKKPRWVFALHRAENARRVRPMCSSKRRRPLRISWRAFSGCRSESAQFGNSGSARNATRSCRRSRCTVRTV